MAVKNELWESHSRMVGNQYIFGQLNHLGQKTVTWRQKLQKFFSVEKLDFSSNIVQVWYFIALLVYLTFQVGHI